MGCARTCFTEGEREGFLPAPIQANTYDTRPRPVSPYYSDTALEMAEQFNASLKGDVPPEEAAGTLQEQLQNIIEQAF